MTSAGNILATVSLACIAALPGSTSAEPLGRLFFTPEQRAVLERQRQANSSEQEIAGTVLTLNGIMVGSDGRAAVWINNRPLRGGVTGAGVRADIASRDSHHATLRTADDAAITLRVGESVDRATHRKTDVLLPDAIRVNHSDRLR